jgi:hypothetical protein
MAITITWNRVAVVNEFNDGTPAGICNMGGRLVMVAGSTGSGLQRGAVYYSDNNGATWLKGSDLAMFSSEGVGASPSDKSCGLLCYKPGTWLHPEDGDGFQYFGSSGDAGGIVRSHEGDAGPGVPIFNVQGWGAFGRPCLERRKDNDERKFAIWPGSFIYWAFGPEPAGPLLLELTQAGATSLTTAFLLNQLDPGGSFFAAGQYPDGSIMWLWVTNPPRLSIGSPADGWDLFMVATQDGVIWRVHGPSLLNLQGRATATSYNLFTDAFFTSDGVLLCGVNVSGLSPCIFRSTDRGVSLTEIVMPGNFFNFIPQGAKGSFIFSGLFVMTHAFCEFDDGTLLCAGGAPTAVGDPLNIGGESAYHYPVVWRSTDKGLTWENVSLGVADFGTRLPLESSELWEGRILLSLGGQSALMVTHIDATFPVAGGPPGEATTDWSPFFITEDGGTTFQKSAVPRVGLMTGAGGVITRPFLYPIQATFANDGSILVVFTDWDTSVEIWRGTYGSAPQEHRAVGFVEEAELAGGSTFDGSTIPEQELIRG